MTNNFTKIMFGVFVLLFVTALAQSTQAEVVPGCDDNGCFYTFDTVFSASTQNYLSNVIGVTSVTTGGGMTRIDMTDELFEQVQSGQNGLLNYARGLERIQIRNNDMKAPFPDNQPAPYCMRDVVTSQINGLYSVNGVLFVNKNDTRC